MTSLSRIPEGTPSPETLPIRGPGGEGWGTRYASADELISLEDAHTSGAYPKRPVVLVRGQGARVWDAEGREYIDCIAGHGVAGLGHCHPAVTAAIA